jgi:glycosyltransferase involved in cell wall biosynthesis
MQKTKFPFFSIIIPSYNQGSFIENCLQSIIKQDFTNYEVIVQDNLSDDNTKSILEKYQQYKNIYINYEKDFGQADAITRGLKKAKGIWVTWQNCDDFYNENNIFKIFYNEINSTHGNYGAFYGNMRVSLYKKINQDFDLRYYGVNFFTLLFEQSVVSNQCCFWKLESHKKLGYLKNYYNSFDYEWFLRFSTYYKFKKIKYKKTISTFLVYSAQKSYIYSKYDQKLRNKILQIYRGKLFSNFICVYFLSRVSLFFRFICIIMNGDLYYLLKKKNLISRIFLKINY